MKKVGILYICTGKYSIFWDGFYKSCEKYFLPDCEKHYHVWSDNRDIMEAFSESSNVHTHFQEVEPWPLPTLMRFHYFLSVKEELLKYDYLVFMNGNLMVQNEILSKDILPRESEKLFVTLHPGYFSKAPVQYTYDDNSESSAYIPKGEGKYYFAGGFNGGVTGEFIKLMEILDARIISDYEKGIIALWHDESQLNRYMLDYPEKFRMLSPAFLFPEDYGEEIPFECKILVLNKRKFGGHKSLRGQT